MDNATRKRLEAAGWNKELTHDAARPCWAWVSKSKEPGYYDPHDYLEISFEGRSYSNEQLAALRDFIKAFEEEENE